jgi:O-antigen/teichoic acid export membrane protein
MGLESPSSTSFDSPSPDPSERHSTPILRTALALLSVQGATWASTLIAVLIIPRFLGANLLGTYTTLLTMAALVTLAGGFGTTNEIVKQVARNPDRSRDIVFHAAMTRFALWLACFFVSMVATAVITKDVELTQISALVLGATGLGLINGAFQSGLQGAHKMSGVAVATAAIGITTQAVIIIVVIVGGRIMPISVVGLVAALASALVSGWLAWRHLKGGISWSSGTARSLVRGGLPFLAWEAALNIYGGIDYLVLASLTSSSIVGNYAFAYRLAGIPIFASTIITAAIYPSLASAAGRDDEWFSQILTRGVQYVVIATFPMAVGLSVLSPELVNTVGGQGRFLDAVPLLAILAFHVPLASIHSLLGTSLFARDRQRFVAVVAWFAAVLNPAANFVAIPLAEHAWRNGAIGAAIVTCATEVFMGIWVWRATVHSISPQAVGGTALRSALACAAMAVVVRLALPAAGIFGAIALGAAVYAILCLPLRLVGPNEVVQLRSAMRRNPVPAE